MIKKNEDKRIRRTKLQLKQAFIKLMTDKDYDLITVTDIITEADYNRTTFYRHYKYKEELVEEIISDRTNELIKAIKYPYSKYNRINLISLIPSDIIVFDHIKDHKDFYELWGKFAVIPGFEEKFSKSISEFFKKEIVLLTSFDKTLNNDLFTSFYAHGILGMILDWIKNDLEPEPAYMANQLVKILNFYPNESYSRTKR